MSDRVKAFLMGCVAILCGTAVIYVGDMLITDPYLSDPRLVEDGRLVGHQLELFQGSILTFSNPYWIVNLFVIPVIGGFVVSLVYGLGGKLLCYFAPAIARIASYVTVSGIEEMPYGITVLPLGYWVLILIVAIEAAAIGGILGEILIKNTYGRRPKDLLYKQASESNSSPK